MRFLVLSLTCLTLAACEESSGGGGVSPGEWGKASAAAPTAQSPKAYDDAKKRLTGELVDIHLPTRNVMQPSDLWICEAGGGRADAERRARVAAADWQGVVGTAGGAEGFGSPGSLAKFETEYSALVARNRCVISHPGLRGYRDVTYPVAALYASPPGIGVTEVRIRCYYDITETEADATRRAGQAMAYAKARQTERWAIRTDYSSEASIARTRAQRTAMLREARSAVAERYKCALPANVF
ncbi:hypothetical protein [Ponticoccus alexandrii]|uniref:Lipoprotein n=1 Tax=Ponticoccus alexandrii TaxID=1943633 RepID=A0ABX7FC64_9RHOB|nr:hypothetical protein [Ponticoccus alexandrii]ETA50787.1 hypothetical protein P279_17565 [Rhodobacteraceae bacterium PD-2]QRF68160.1 hypothetical protein GQA70_18690 [Ponticoccus alexandrii]